MTVKLNGDPHNIIEGTTLAEFVQDLGLQPRGIAIAIDYRVVPKEEWADTILTEGMELMMIHAVSGG